MRTAVVTGAARGIGRAVARRLVEQGYAVVVTDLAGEDVRRTAAEVGAVAGLAQDVRDPASHVAVAEEAGRHGELALWVNNAGIAHDGRLVDLTDGEVDALVDVNLKGVLWGMRAALSAFGPSGGDVVNIASASGLGPVPHLSVYAATKAAVVSVTTSTALELPSSVRVHALCPVGVATDMVVGMDQGGPARSLIHAGGRLLTTDEVADAAVGLVGSRRVVRSIPAVRGGLVRLGALAPSRSGPAFAAVDRLGRRFLR